MKATLSLEDFNETQKDQSEENVWRQMGYDEGYAKAKSECDTQNTEAIHKVSQSISDLSFKAAELKANLTQDFSDVLASAVEALLPPLKAHLFTEHIHAAIDQMFAEFNKAKLQVEVGASLPPEAIRAINLHGAGIEVVTSERLKSGEALITHPEKEIMIDFEETFEAIRDALSPITNQSIERKSA